MNNMEILAHLSTLGERESVVLDINAKSANLMQLVAAQLARHSVEISLQQEPTSSCMGEASAAIWIVALKDRKDPLPDREAINFVRDNDFVPA